MAAEGESAAGVVKEFEEELFVVKLSGVAAGVIGRLATYFYS